MKKLILTILTTITILGVNAQGNNLQFNQVINNEYTLSSFLDHRYTQAGSITVPTNKVYKITSASAYRWDGGSNDYTTGCSIKVGENILYDYSYSNGGQISNTPVWLSSGTYIVYLRSLAQFSELKGALSIVEFNIVP